MLGLLGAFCVLGAGVSLDGEDAMARARLFLNRLGFGNPTSIQRLAEVRVPQREPYWSLDFATEYGSTLVELNVKDGRPLRVLIVGRVPDSRGTNEPATPQTEQRAWAALHALGLDKNVCKDAFVGFLDTRYDSTFYLTRHGLRFFNMNPTFAHRLYFDPQTGILTDFLASPELPEVNAWKPRIGAKTAADKIKDWAARTIKRWKTMQQDDHSRLVVELGYYKFEKETKARLVWRMNRYSRIDDKRYGFGPLRIFVDALTGEMIEPDDPLWRPET